MIHSILEKKPSRGCREALDEPFQHTYVLLSDERPGTALQTNLGVSFESTMTFISENVTLNFTESNEVVKKKIYIALFEKIDFFSFLAENHELL